MKKSASIFSLLLLIVLSKSANAQNSASTISNAAFRLQYSEKVIAGLWKTADLHPTNYVRRGKNIADILIRYKANSWDSIHNFPESDRTFILNGKQQAYFAAVKKQERPLVLKETWELKDQSLNWTFSIENAANKQLTIGDIAIPLFYNNQSGENSKEIFEERVIKHHFIS